MSETRSTPTLDLSEEDLAPLIERSALIGMLTAAHAVAEQLDTLAAAIAEEVGVEPDSEEITESVFNMTDAPDAADLLLKARQPRPKEHLQ